MATLEEMLDLKKRFEESKRNEEVGQWQNIAADVANTVVNRPTYESIMLKQNPQLVDFSGNISKPSEKPSDVADLYAKYQEAQKNRENALEMKKKELAAAEENRKAQFKHDEDIAGIRNKYELQQIAAKEKNQAAKDKGALDVPEFTIAQGAKPTSKDAEEVKSANQANKAIQTSLADMKAIIQKSGPEMVGQNADTLDAIATDVRLKAKELYRLGQLSQGDLAMLDSLIPQGTSFSDWIKVNAGPKLINRLTNAQNIMNKTLESAAQARGYVKNGATQGPSGDHSLDDLLAEKERRSNLQKAR